MRHLKQLIAAVAIATIMPASGLLAQEFSDMGINQDPLTYGINPALPSNAGQKVKVFFD